mmetsp:Transcript_26369/g.72812  ORF Transcript_26369/g.72812 Transcript_26369/m.72812 type:complete len:279 (-) Transcript_26369:30-866(-)
MRHEFTINAMQNGFKIITLTRILAVKEFHELEAKLLVHIFLGRFGVDLRADNEAEEEFISNLQVGPSRLQHGLVLLGVKVIGCRRQRTANIGRHHRHQVPHDGFGENLLTCRCVNVVDKFQESLALHIFSTFVGRGIIKGENDTAQFELHDKKFFALCGWSIAEGGEVFERRPIRSRCLYLNPFEICCGSNSSVFLAVLVPHFIVHGSSGRWSERHRLSSSGSPFLLVSNSRRIGIFRCRGSGSSLVGVGLLPLSLLKSPNHDRRLLLSSFRDNKRSF